ncbi:MAG: DUF4268 domain-containing protein [Candidatus Poseidoniia archaeon]|jgi:hypothetical protein|nr:DUF4268 domain-containing protein [Candidatus Poseidoniia archaeon]MDP6846238.1 DUF4268 domain-containing protein [Candidatus Poseidoniia archaeon]
MNLGRLKKVPLREVWKTEAGDFTPWLAQEEHIELLGNELGLDLEVEAQEKNVGPFKADILCKDTVTENWVLIENQLEKTDHTHLGQLLTYAAGLKAVTIVWIADEFTNQHRAALDWLNNITDETFNFFGVKVELWKIGESPFAPKFNIVSKPNDWSQRVGQAARQVESGNLSTTKILQREYWTAFSKYILTNSSVIRPVKPRPQHWMNLAIGRTHFGLQISVNTQDNIISICLVFSGPDAKPHYFLSEENKGRIEEEFGEKLNWHPMPEGKYCYICLNNAINPTDKSLWSEQHKWFTEKLEKYYRVFSARIKSLDATQYEET